MRILSVAAVFIISCSLVLACSAGSGQEEVKALQEQIAKQGQLLEEIRDDVEGIKRFVIEGRPNTAQNQVRPVSIDDDYIRGNVDAKVTMIEFSDFQCPYCEKFYKQILPLIDQEYIKTGKVRFVYRDMPIDNIHKDASKAAEAAQCAGDQGKFWEMHDKIFDNQKAIRINDLKGYAKELGLSTKQFNQCLDSGKHTEEVRKDAVDAQTAGINGTPTFFVGLTGKDKTIQGTPIRGTRPYQIYKEAIDNLLNEENG